MLGKGVSVIFKMPRLRNGRGLFPLTPGRLEETRSAILAKHSPKTLSKARIVTIVQSFFEMTEPLCPTPRTVSFRWNSQGSGFI